MIALGLAGLLGLVAAGWLFFVEVEAVLVRGQSGDETAAPVYGCLLAVLGPAMALGFGALLGFRWWQLLVPPALVALLVAARALAGVAGRRPFWLLHQLEASDPDVRVLALEKLGPWAQARAAWVLEALLAGLRDPDVRVKAAAAAGLHEAGRSDAALRSLGALLRETGPLERAPVIAACIRVGRVAVPMLVDVLEDTSASPELRSSVADALGRIGDPDATRPLVELLREGLPEMRAAAAWALGPLRQRSALGPLRAALADADAGVRMGVTTALGAIGQREDAAALLARLRDDEDVHVRGAAARGLGEMRALEAVAALTSALDDPSPLVRAEAATALGRIGDVAPVGPLGRALRDPVAFARAQAASALAGLGWRPESAEDRAWDAVARGSWDEAVRHGAAAVGPLLVAVRDESTAEGVLRALTRVLEQDAARVAVADLRSLASLTGVRMLFPRDYEPVELDASRVRQLAGAELARREREGR